jgi:hypothetical protein
MRHSADVETGTAGGRKDYPSGWWTVWLFVLGRSTHHGGRKHRSGHAWSQVEDIQTKGVAMNIPQIYILVTIIFLAVITVLVFAIGKRGKEIPINKTLFAIGLLIVGIAVVLLLMDVIESGVAAAIGILGIGLIAASGRSNIKRMH